MSNAIVVVPSSYTLTASNVDEDDAGTWNYVTSYTTDTDVIYQHGIWTAVTNNSGQTPSEESAYWSYKRATNRYRAFDGKVLSPTTNAETITYTLTMASHASAVAILGVDAISIRVRVVDDGVETYDKTEQLVEHSAANWFDYTYSELTYATERVFVDVPAYAGAKIYITIDAGSGAAEVGEIIVGYAHNIGTATKASLGFVDYSVKEADEFGAYDIVERDYSDTMTLSLIYPKGDNPRIERLIAKLRATPALWVADYGQSDIGATAYGFVEDWNPVIDDGSHIIATLEIEGV